MTKKKNLQFNAEDVFFTSDPHFYHTNIIRFCNRPFATVEEMNEKLIENWNSVVKDTSHVFLLGDVCFGNSSAWYSIVPRLKGHIHLILGNHDNQQDATYDNLFESVDVQLEITIKDYHYQKIILNHYPLLSWGGYQRGVWNLFGHIHSVKNATTLEGESGMKLSKTQYDVGVDNNNYTPVSFTEIVKIMEQQNKQNMNEGLKNDIKDKKIRWDLLPLDILNDIAMVYTAGAEKYGDNNWQNLENGYERYKGALLRHLYAATKEVKDEETGCYHLAQVAWNAIAMLWLHKNNKLDPKRSKCVRSENLMSCC